MSSIPSCDLTNIDYEMMFSPQSKGTGIKRVFSQIAMLFSNLGRGGGYFRLLVESDNEAFRLYGGVIKVNIGP